jgi:hypothetical protein
LQAASLAAHADCISSLVGALVDTAATIARNLQPVGLLMAAVTKAPVSVQSWTASAAVSVLSAALAQKLVTIVPPELIVQLLAGTGCMVPAPPSSPSLPHPTTASVAANDTTPASLINPFRI